MVLDLTNWAQAHLRYKTFPLHEIHTFLQDQIMNMFLFAFLFSVFNIAQTMYNVHPSE